ncbi:MAG: pentapeptide repeat-containing protein [Gammaproteobacteria bacterium]|nr:pentapeptide repeat-containing protein [Gammaproteobacteria bacterium]
MIEIYDKKGFDQIMVIEATSLKNIDLRGAHLKEANLVQYDFTGADLRGANLQDADLRLVNFTGADLTGANLMGADLTGAILTDTKMDRPKVIPIVIQG